MSNVYGQVNINLSVKPPFTPFISDYTNPARLQDITVSLFNQSGEDLRLKFSIVLENKEKGIHIALKEDANPIRAYELFKNEFKFLVLEDISNLYGSLNQNNFEIKGASIENLILDGTIPDGVYEVCLRAYDFDAPGFSKPLSDISPMGCFSFQVNYTDPPTDIRFNNNLLQYRFGGVVPKIGVNGALGQNYSIQFTPPALNLNSLYEYELMIFSETVINPNLQQENTILTGISSIIPIISQTSNVPFFSITNSDLELDFGKNYYLLIKATDLNEKTLFKNKGYSTFKAFQLIDIQNMQVSAPSISNAACGGVTPNAISLSKITWNNNLDLLEDSKLKNLIETRIKIVRMSNIGVTPNDVFSTSPGELLFDTVIQHKDGLKIKNELSIANRFHGPENNRTKWVIGVQNRLIELNEFTNNIHFDNNGKSQCEIEINSSPQHINSSLVLKVEYPLNNDTLPFNFPPIVVRTDNLAEHQKLIFTKLNSQLEILESFKYLKTSLDADLNSQFNSLALDTSINMVANYLNQAAKIQILGEHPEDANSNIDLAVQLLRSNGTADRIQITHALNSKKIPLGAGANGKMAFFNKVMRYNAALQATDNSELTQIPNISNLLFPGGFKNNILWNAKVGVYSDNFFFNLGMNFNEYEEKFRNNSFSSDELLTEMLSKGLLSGSGSFNIGMKTPILKSKFEGRTLSNGKITLTFKPSTKPNMLLPGNPDANDVWKEFSHLSVAQQWNVEIASDKEFKHIDTVISKRIIKNYDIKTVSTEIERDLYDDVNLTINLQTPGKYYWRVTWSNVTVNENAIEAEKNYFRQLANLLATSQFLGESDINPDSFFFIRSNYRYSAIDSFSFNNTDTNATAKAPRYELIYPLNNDTIPFMYPPVVIKNNQTDSSYKFILSRFNSNLEPFSNQTYLLIDSTHVSSQRLRNLSYDSLHNNLVIAFKELSRQQLYGIANESSMDKVVNQFSQLTEKKGHLEFETLSSPRDLFFGNSPVGKLNLIHLLAERNALQQLSVGNSNPETPNLSEMAYVLPYKDVVWNARFAHYSPIGLPYTSVDSFESMFNNNVLHYGSNINPNNKQGMAFFNGNFSVGMKTPELTMLSGKNVNKNKIEVEFKPSVLPSKLLPESPNNSAEWQNLFVAQQWNIEVSNTSSFDSLIFVKSKCFIKEYSLNESENIQMDLYNNRKERIANLPVGKYYYRVTWSNPTMIDTNNTLHKKYAKFQNLLITQSTILNPGNVSENELENFYHLNRINYKYSAVDSFVAIDSTSRDTAECGLACLFSMNNISQIAVTQHIKSGDVVQVGQFNMKIKNIVFNNVSKTATGEGSIECQLFPAPIAVNFNNVKFNSDKRLIEGNIKAKNKNDDLINNYISNNTSVLTSITNKYINYLSIKNGVNQVVNNATEGEIENLYDYLNSPACLLINAALGEEVTMPFGLSKEVDNFPHTIAVTDIVFTPTEAKFNAAAMLSIHIGFQNTYMGFGFSDICLTPKGIASVSNGGALELMGSIDIPFGDYSKFRIIGRDLDTLGRFGTSGTRVVWDCKGFKHIDLKASISMSRELMKPVAGKKILGGKVNAIGHAVISSMNNWMLSLDFDSSFQLSVLPGFVFTSHQASVDFSDVSNPQDMTFPLNYLGTKDRHWKGLYFKELGIRLPDVFSEKDTVNGLNFSVRDLIADESGITASLGIQNLLNLETGTLGAWQYSIDSLSIDIVNNIPRNCKLRGDIKVPLFENSFKYNMLLTSNRTNDSLFSQLNIQPNAQVRMPAWFASVNLLPSSYIRMYGNLLNPKSMVLESNFNGDISIASNDIGGLKDIQLGTLPFEGLRIRTQFNTFDSFRMHLDKLGGVNMNRVISNTELPNSSSTPITQTSSTPLKTGGFPINISNFSMDAFFGKCLFDLEEEAGIRMGIKFKININIADAGDNAIGGSCGMGLYASVKVRDQKWNFGIGGLNIDTIRIEAALSGAIIVKGGIAFIANDPVYGNGVAGFLMADLPPTIKVGVSGMFGEVNNMRYWMFGAFGQINPGIPIDFSANVIYANSISAEVWYKMTRTPGSAASQASGFQIGRSPSGASFVPSANASFGFGAALGLTGPPGSPLFGDVGLYVEFNNGGGLSKLTMEGNLWLPTNNKATAPVLVNCNATIDIDNEKFEANLSALVNVGPNIVRGRTIVSEAGTNYYLAGNGKLLIDKKNDEWYIKLGDPFIENGKMGFGFYAGNELIFESGGYMMMGNKLPQSLPPMSDDLKSKLLQAGIDIPKEQSSNRTGFAILMGVDANIPEKKIEMGAFYAGLALQFSMDGLLAPGLISCPNRNGVNGYYMIGKAYAAVNGAIGIHVDMPMYTGDIIVAEMNAGMLLDAGAPNPYYFKGQFTVNYSVMGGLIEGNKKLNFELAEDNNCKPNVNSSQVSFSQLVADVSPAKNAIEVPVGVEPVIALNFGYNKKVKYKIPTTVRVNGKDITVAQEVSIRLKSDYVQIIENSNRNRKVTLFPSSDGKQLRVRPDSFLKGGISNYVLRAKFYIEKLNTSTNTWERVRKKNNAFWDTSISINFQTEEVPLIRATDISYSTPLQGENYFKKGDYSYGKLVFKQNNAEATFFIGQLRTTSPYRDIDFVNGYNTYYAQFAHANDNNPSTKYALTFYNNEVRFQLPTTMDSSKLFQLRIVREKVPGTGLRTNSVLQNRIITDGINFKTQTAEVVADRRVIIYSFAFKTSKFLRMNDKIAQIALSNSTIAFTNDSIRVTANTREPFELFEVKAFNYPLPSSNITLPAALQVNNISSTAEDNEWIRNFYVPKIYKAGDTLQRKKGLTSTFYNLSKTNSLVIVSMNEHIMQPLKTSGILFTYDLRLAANNYTQLNNTLIQNNSFSNNLSLNLFTGSNSSTTNSIEPGDQIHFTYYQYKNCINDFNKLKTLANNILLTQPTTWYLGMTSQEIQLLNRVRSSNFVFMQPYNTDKFIVSLHRNSISSTAVKKLNINHNLFKPMSLTTITISSTSFSTFGK
jgi:hypothetical protein